MVDSPVVFWLLPLSWALHDLEELATLDRWRATHDRALRRLADRSRPGRRLVASLPASRGTFVVAAALVGLLVVGSAAAATVDPRGFGLFVFSVSLGGYALHGVVHVAQAGLFRGYVPGVVTAVVVVAPTAGYLYRWLLATGRLDPLTAAVTAVIGLVLFVPVVVVAGHVARALRSR